MAGRAERLGHAAGQAGQHPACRPHASRNENRLPGKGTSRTLAVNQHAFLPVTDDVRFELRDVVSDIIDNRHMRVFTKDSLECAACRMGNALAVGPGKIRRGRHGFQVTLSFG